MKNVVEQEDCVVMQLSDESGEGTMTLQQIFEGAYLLYNDMHLSRCESHFQLKRDAQFLCIDHCREGRMENQTPDNTFCYLQEKEMRVDDRRNHAGRVIFPLNHYHGVTVGFDLDLAISSLRKFFGGFSVNLTELRRKYCGEGGPYIIRDEPGIERIFADLYFVPREIKRDYYRVKALELLLYLDALRLSEAGEERPYFYKSQVEKIKAIHRLITEDLQTRYTLEELADRFSVSLTAMKKCFKAIYGDSMYAYLRRFRMNAAATALRREPEKSIAEIAGLVGYESPSKFSAAFHQIMGQTPAEYRKSFF